MMTEGTLHESQSKILGALTIVVAQRLGAQTSLLEQDNGVRQVSMGQI